MSNFNDEEGFFGNNLLSAVFAKSLSLVQIVVGKGAQIDQRSKFGTALRLAAVTGQSNIVRWLLKKGADCNVQDKDLGDCLQGAAAKGHIDIMQMLLDSKADVDGQHGFFENTLQAASFHGHKAAVELLVKANAKLERSGRFPDALHAAIYGNQPEIIKVLLMNGANANPRVMMEMSRARRLPQDVLSQMPRKPLPDLTLYPASTWNTGALQAAATLGNLPLIKTLVWSGVELNTTSNACEFNALQIASFKGHKRVVSFLLDRGAHINAVGGSLGSALHASIAASNFSLAELLLSRGANIDIHWRDFGSPLQIACERSDLSAIRFLHGKGANINDSGGRNGTALQVAAFEGQLEVVRLLISMSAEIQHYGRLNGSALQAASTKGFTGIMRTLIENGADVEAVGRMSGTALHCAVEAGQTEAVFMLLQHGANVNGGDNGFALQTASTKGFTQITKLLLEYGAKIDSIGQRNGTALYCAAEAGQAGALSLLLQQGANIDACKGETVPALHIATFLRHESLVQILLDYDADVHMKGKLYRPRSYSERQTFYWNEPLNPLYIASMQGQLGIAKMILNRGLRCFVDDGSLVEATKVATYHETSKDLPFMFLKTGIESGLEIDQFRDSMLIACAYGNQDLVEYFLNAGINPNILGKLVETRRLLHNVTGIPAIRLLNDDGIDQCPLHAAAFHGRKKIVEILVNAGADVNATTSTGVSPLDKAICGIECQDFSIVTPPAKVKLETVRLLIEACNNADQLNGDSLLLLQKKVVEYCDLDLFELLVARLSITQLRSSPMLAELMMNATKNNRIDVLLYALDFQPPHGFGRAALQTSLRNIIEEGQRDMLRVVVERAAGARDIIEDHRSDLLIRASKKGFLDGVNYLLLTARHIPRATISEALKICRDVDIIERILDHVHKITVEQSQSPIQVDQILGYCLVRAVRRTIGSSGLVPSKQSHHLPRSLIRLGADINFQNEKDESALFLTARLGNPERELQCQGINSKFDADQFHLLLEQGADPNIRGGDFGTPLIAAAARGATDKVRLLLEAGADPNIQLGAHGTALSAAAACSSTVLYSNTGEGRIGIILLLLQHGAAVNTEPEEVGPWGSALQAAAYGGHARVIKLLLEHGANVNARGGVLGSALTAAAYKGSREVARMLLQHGADVNFRGGYHGSVLRAARSRQFGQQTDNLEEMLLDVGADWEETTGEKKAHLTVLSTGILAPFQNSSWDAGLPTYHHLSEDE